MTAREPVPRKVRAHRRPAVSVAARGRFVEALEAGWSVLHAAEKAGVHRRRLYELREADEEFAAEWDDALAAGTQVLEDEVRRRAAEGWDEPVYQRGELVGHVRRYSDVLLMFLLKKRDPSYRDNARVEVTGRDGGPVELASGYQPPTLADVVKLAGDLGVIQRGEVIDGEAIEVPELTRGEDG